MSSGEHGASRLSPLCRNEASNQALALRWGGEQLEGARQAINAARAALKALKAAEKKRKQKVGFLHAARRQQELYFCECASCRLAGGRLFGNRGLLMPRMQVRVHAPGKRPYIQSP